MFNLNLRDFIKGVILAVIVPALLTVQQALMNPPIDWKLIGITAIATFIGYLVKNLFTDKVSEAKATIAAAREKELNG